ncbi:hypothetical protein QJ133_03195 [Priestia megaterium]|uniref:hypothetical protein n=1 Tax=Priestia megaterium TaxID=1404 RepID=UPI00249B0A4C|nr:hypothetical protein [Priestia megaterium]MDI3090179.1 hypothetical protein [Priestia megaterium]
MQTFLISFVEDNELGIYNKDIFVEGTDISVCFQESIKKYPTLYGIREIFGEIEERWKSYYTHETQDQLRRSELGHIEQIRATSPE